MARIVSFAPRGGLSLSAELERAGHTVFKALAISEVFDIIEHENIDRCFVRAGNRKSAAASRSKSTSSGSNSLLPRPIGRYILAYSLDDVIAVA